MERGVSAEAPRGPVCGRILAVAAILRLGSWLAWRPRVVDDSMRFLIDARAIARLDATEYIAGRTPGYPLFLALLARNPLLVTLVQGALGVVTVALVYELTWRLTRRAAPAVGAAAVQAVLLPAIGLETYLYTETLATTLLCATALAAERSFATGARRAWTTTGLLAAATVLTRPEYVVLVALLGALALRRHVRAAALAAGPTAAALLLLATFNAVVVRQFTVTTFTGCNLMNHVGPFVDDAPREYRDIVELYVPARARQIERWGNPDQTIWLITDELERRSPGFPAHQGVAFARASRRVLGLALTQIGRHPAAYARSAADSWLTFWAGQHAYEPERLRNPGNADLAEAAADVGRLQERLVHAAFFASAAVLLALWATRRRREPAAVYVLAAAVLVGTVAPSLLEHGRNMRFAVPYAPWMLAVVAATVFRRP